MDEHEEYKQRELAFYSAMLNAWLTTKLELDKHLLSLATFALGLLVTLSTTVGIRDPHAQILAIFSAFFFCTTVFTVLTIFDKNASMVMSVVKDSEEQSKTTKEILARLDYSAGVSFKLGVLLLIAAAVTISVTQNKEQSVSNSQTNEPIQHHEKCEPAKYSWDKVSELQPKKPEPPAKEGDKQSG